MENNNFFKSKLKNGATILFEKRKSPVSTIMVGFNVGSSHETAAKKGIAHFVEHNLFKGSIKRTQQQISSGIEKKGGILNGFTADELTAYWAKIPSNHTIFALDILSDMALNPKFSIDEMNKERHVVLEEIKMNHDNPQMFVMNELKKQLYLEPFSIGGLGTERTVNELTHSDLKNWHSLYNTKNLAISIVGNSDIQEIKDYLNKIKAQSKTEANNPMIKTKFSQNIFSRKGIDQAHLCLGFHVPSLSSREKYAVDLFNTILGEGMSSLLFQEVREKRGLVYTIKSFIESEKSYGDLIVYAGTDKKKIKDVKEISLKMIKQVAKINQRDFNEAKEQCIGSWEVANEKSDNVATNLLFNEVANKAEDYYAYIKEIEKLKIKDISKFSNIRGYGMAALVPK